jgi:hypothetical protein
MSDNIGDNSPMAATPVQTAATPVQTAAPVVNRTLKDLNLKLGQLADLQNRDVVNMLRVDAIIPGREAEGLVNVDVGTVKYQANEILKKIERNTRGNGSIPPMFQEQVNNLYNGLQKAIDLAKTTLQKAGRRRTKRSQSKRRRQSKRRGQSRRRRGSRK